MNAQSRPRIFRGRVTFLLSISLACLMLVGSAITRTGTAHAACSGHCYGVAEWPNAIHGTHTEIETTSLGTNNNQYHISNEMWLLDSAHSCVNNSISWVEAGEATQYKGTGTWYFWADCRPGSKEIDHWVYPVPQSDYASYFQYFIYQDSGNSYHVEMDTAQGYGLWHAESTYNSMVPNYINVGTETTSAQNTIGSYTPFIYNEYQGTNGIWGWQANPGNPPTGHSDSPPYWYWNVIPAPGNQGGSGASNCC